MAKSHNFLSRINNRIYGMREEGDRDREGERERVIEEEQRKRGREREEEEEEYSPQLGPKHSSS